MLCVTDDMTGDQGPDEGATYFVDQAGHYYYQTPGPDGQQVMTVVSGEKLLSNFLFVNN